MVPPVEIVAVEQRLAGTALAGAPLTELPLPGAGGSTPVVDLPAEADLVSSWAAVRDAMAPLGRLPVAATSWGGSGWPEEDLFARCSYGEEDDAAPDAVIARAHALTVEQALERFPLRDTWARDNWEEVVELELARTERGYGGRPEPQLLGDVPPGDGLGLERRLLAWEEAQRPTVPCTTALSGDGVRDLARHLLHGERWFLHERP